MIGKLSVFEAQMRHSRGLGVFSEDYLKVGAKVWAKIVIWLTEMGLETSERGK